MHTYMYVGFTIAISRMEQMFFPTFKTEVIIAKYTHFYV